MATISLSIFEITLLFIMAVILGITIHFFIISRRGLKMSSLGPEKNNKETEQWKLKYFNDIEYKDKEITSLKKQLADTEENNDINSIEADEMRKLNKQLQAEIETLRNSLPTSTAIPEKPGYIEQLRQAQSSLMEHNEKINQLLGQIDIVKETEEKQIEILKSNEELSLQIDDLKLMLSQKEREINNIHKKEHLTSEMTSMLDSAYNEFNVLQDKIQKLESQVNASKRISLEYEDLKEVQYKTSRDYEEQKIKYNGLLTENQQLRADLTQAEAELKEATFHWQQLQKKVSYLEELNNDMQAVADAHKKLEGQLKRMGELESMLNVVAEERDELARKQYKTS